MDNPRLVAEAMLQHYGYSTHFIDLVDNHWIALWFGLNKFRTIKNLSEYCLYEKRVVNPIELLSANEDHLLKWNTVFLGILQSTPF